MECRISPEVELCTGNDRLRFQTFFGNLAGLVMNKSGKSKLTGFYFFTDLEHVFKRFSVNSFLTVKPDKCGDPNMVQLLKNCQLHRNKYERCLVQNS